MLLQYNTRGLFIRNYHQLDFSSTHVSIDSVKLEFSGWGRTEKRVHKNWKIKSSIFATDQPDRAQADFEKDCRFKNKFENSLIHCECLMERDQEMSLKYIEYRNLLFRWGFPSFRSRFPSELTWFWQNFAFQSYLCAECHLIHRKFHHFNHRNLVSNFSNFDSIFKDVMTIFEIFSNSVGGQTCFKLNHKVGLCHGRLTALNLRMRVSWLWWYNSRGRY